MIRFGTRPAIALIVLVCGRFGAGDPVRPGPEVENLQQLQAYVAVADLNGRPVSGLRTSDVMVQLGQLEATALSAMPASEPLALVFATEGAGLEQTLGMRNLLKAAVEFIRRTHPNTRVGLMLAPGAGVPVLHEVGEQLDQLYEEISEFVGGAETASLPSSIRIATQTLSQERSGRRAVVALSLASTRDREAKSSPIQSDLRAAGVSFWSLEAGDSGAGDYDQERLFAAATRASGGRRYLVSANAASAGLQQLLAVLLSQYLVTYVVPPDADTNAELRFGLRNRSATIFGPIWIR